MPGNVEQQLILERMHAKYLVDKMNANANQQLVNRSLSNSGLSTAQQRIFHDASTHTYDLMQSIDVEMKSVWSINEYETCKNFRIKLLNDINCSIWKAWLKVISLQQRWNLNSEGKRTGLLLVWFLVYC